MALTVRRFAASDPNLHNAALQALALSAADNFAVGDVLEFKFGSELQTIQFLGHVTAFRPYGSADLHLSPNTVVEYDYTTSRPDLRTEKGFDSAPADLSESNPRVSLLAFAPKMESAHHQEVSVSHRMPARTMSRSPYSPTGSVNPALTGTGETTAAGGFLLPDISSGTFSYAGKNARYQRPAGRPAAQVLQRPDRDSRLRLRWRSRSLAARRCRCRTPHHG